VHCIEDDKAQSVTKDKTTWIKLTLIISNQLKDHKVSIKETLKTKDIRKPKIYYKIEFEISVAQGMILIFKGKCRNFVVLDHNSVHFKARRNHGKRQIDATSQSPYFAYYRITARDKANNFILNTV
jgi:hypothetical protein